MHRSVHFRQNLRDHFPEGIVVASFIGTGDFPVGIAILRVNGERYEVLRPCKQVEDTAFFLPFCELNHLRSA